MSISSRQWFVETMPDSYLGQGSSHFLPQQAHEDLGQGQLFESKKKFCCGQIYVSMQQVDEECGKSHPAA